MPDPNNILTYGAVPNNPTFDNYAAFKKAIDSGYKSIHIPPGTYYFSSKDVVHDCCVYLNKRVSFTADSSQNTALVSAAGLAVGSVLKIDLTIENGQSVNPYSQTNIHVVGGDGAERAGYVYMATHLAIRDCYFTLTKTDGIAGLGIGESGNDNAGWWMGELSNTLIVGANGHASTTRGIDASWVVTGVQFKANRVQNFGTGFYANRMYYSTVDMEVEICDLGYEFSLARSIRAFLATEHCDQGAIFRAFTGLISGHFSNLDGTNGMEFAEKDDEATLGNVATINDAIIAGTVTNPINISHDRGEITMPPLLGKSVVGHKELANIHGAYVYSPNGTLYKLSVSDAGVVSTVAV